MSIARPPAIPLIVHDPGLSVWAIGDRLADHHAGHWTGHNRGLALIARVDGEAWSLIGKALPRCAEQLSVEVTATRTICRFACSQVAVTVTFCSPLLADDLDLLSRPLSTITVEAVANDGATHQVEVYCDLGCEWAADTVSQPVQWHPLRVRGLEVMRAGTAAQAVLARSGDNLRTDWGWIHLAVAADGRQSSASGADSVLRTAFCMHGRLANEDDLRQPRPTSAGWVKLAIAVNLGQVGQVGSVVAHTTLVVAYDDGFCIEYLHRRLRPYWARDGRSFADVLSEGFTHHAAVLARCVAFDARLATDCERAGGPEYRDLCVLAYRQAIAAHKLAADIDGTPLFFSKENFSNGCIATVDVTYPSAPLFLWLAPALLEGMVMPILTYAETGSWRFPFAPHDLGTFPLANGQVYGGGEESERDQMPVEECGNMLVLVAAICRARTSPEYARRWWPTLLGWADYLIAHGLDPAQQLCTDDFAGHLANNANLALKAVIGVGAAAQIATALGHAEDASRLWATARGMAGTWQDKAGAGDHTVLAYGHPDTWSQKYNLVWDQLLGLGLFPPAVAQREVAWYVAHQERYGLPLDSRRTYTKNDWIIWSATMAERDADFRALISPLHRWCSETPNRVPLTDWYDTISGRQEAFQARSVVGGFFIKVLAETWRR